MRRPWIKIETCTSDKPEVCSLATQLRLDEDTVVGKLVRLWSWAELNRINPNDLGVTKEFIDKLVGRKGFASALEKTGWLMETAEKLSFRNFKRHNSPVAHNKALTAKRVARHRLRKAAVNEKDTDKPLAPKPVKALKVKAMAPPNHPAEEVIISDAPLVISEESVFFIEPEVTEDVMIPAEPVTESPSPVEEPELLPQEAAEEVVVAASEVVAEIDKAQPEEIAVATPEVVIEAAPKAPAEEVAVVVPVEEPAPRKRRGKAASEAEDQPMLF